MSNASSASRPSLSSISTNGSSNEFGLPSRKGSCFSDVSNVEFTVENKNSPQNNATTLNRICESYKDTYKDTHTLEDYASMNFTHGNYESKTNGQSVCTWAHQTVRAFVLTFFALFSIDKLV